MTKYERPPMRPELAVCPRCGIDANGRIGIGCPLGAHPERRYKCHECGKTFSDTHGTPLFGLKCPYWLVIVVLTLLAYGCPVQAIVMAFGLDERTVSDWRKKAGKQAKAVQEAVVCAGQVELGQIQGDEFYLRTQCGAVWVATAMSVFSRLFLWGAVSVERNTALVTPVVTQVKAAGPRGLPGGAEQMILWAVDGFGAWTRAIRHAFRLPCYTGQRGRPQLMLWPQLHIVQVVKRYTAYRLTAIERRLVQGIQQTAEAIVHATQVGWGCFNTAYIERLNATFRGWLPIATRRSRTPAARRCHVEAALFWTAVVYNFCHVHASLQATPAMAAAPRGLPTDHLWSIDQLLRYRVQRE